MLKENNIISFLAIFNIVAWILLASAGVMVSRYFDLIWPEYERRAVVDANGVVTGEKLQRRRRFSFFNVHILLNFNAKLMCFLGFSTHYDNSCYFNMVCIFCYSF